MERTTPDSVAAPPSSNGIARRPASDVPNSPPGFPWSGLLMGVCTTFLASQAALALYDIGRPFTAAVAAFLGVFLLPFWMGRIIGHLT